VREKNQQIGILLSKEFLALWATYSENFLDLLNFCFTKMIKVLTMVYIISLMLWFSSEKKSFNNCH
jgi:hypothetical protein